MKRFVVYAAAAAVTLCIAAAKEGTGEFLTHVVKKGETVSLVCIDYYGHYNNAMAAAVRELNSGIKDINLIFEGQKLKLRNPAHARAAKAPATPLEMNVAATQAVVTYVEGTAFLVEKKGRRMLAANTVVEPGQAIETGSDGRVELIVNRESVVRMREDTRLSVSELRDNAKKKGTTTVDFSLGTVWARIRNFADKMGRFQMQLPTAVAGVHGTTYQSSVAPDSASEVKVYEGEVAVQSRARQPSPAPSPSEVPGPQEVAGPHEVSMQRWVEIVRSMQAIRIDKNGTPSKAESFEKVADEWEKWNEERDKRIAEMFARKF